MMALQQRDPQHRDLLQGLPEQRGWARHLLPRETQGSHRSDSLFPQRKLMVSCTRLNMDISKWYSHGLPPCSGSVLLVLFQAPRLRSCRKAGQPQLCKHLQWAHRGTGGHAETGSCQGYLPLPNPA